MKFASTRSIPASVGFDPLDTLKLAQLVAIPASSLAHTADSHARVNCVAIRTHRHPPAPPHLSPVPGSCSSTYRFPPLSAALYPIPRNIPSLSHPTDHRPHVEDKGSRGGGGFSSIRGGGGGNGGGGGLNFFGTKYGNVKYGNGENAGRVNGDGDGVGGGRRGSLGRGLRMGSSRGDDDWTPLSAEVGRDVERGVIKCDGVAELLVSRFSCCFCGALVPLGSPDGLSATRQFRLFHLVQTVPDAIAAVSITPFPYWCERMPHAIHTAIPPKDRYSRSCPLNTCVALLLLSL